MSEHEISSITKEEYAYVITLSDGTCWVQRACPRTGVDYPMSDYEVLLLAMIRERDRLAAEYTELKAAMAWVNEVYPGRAEANGAVIELSWDEFNRMERAIGRRERKRVKDPEGKATMLHRVRQRAKAAEARVAELEKDNDWLCALHKEMNRWYGDLYMAHQKAEARVVELEALLTRVQVATGRCTVGLMEGIRATLERSDDA